VAKLKKPHKHVGITNRSSSRAKHITQLPFKHLSTNANQADTFEDFPTSLMSVGKMADDSTISIFTKDGATIHKEQDVLITLKANVTPLKGKKVQVVHIQVYVARETIFSAQTGSYPTRSQRGNKYIMVMVDIDSNVILVEPMKSRKDAKMIRAYDGQELRLKRAGIIPKKHGLDNDVSKHMKNHI
ncbi:hypothetical protein ACHAW6_007280, partial [Cyclotella cf. meneghiniana]